MTVEPVGRIDFRGTSLNYNLEKIDLRANRPKRPRPCTTRFNHLITYLFIRVILQVLINTIVYTHCAPTSVLRMSKEHDAGSHMEVMPATFGFFIA